MVITQEQLFELKAEIEKQAQEFSRKLIEVQAQQAEEKKVQRLAELLLEYEQLQREISDRGQVFAFLSTPEATVTSPYKKAELFAYIEAAETVGPQIVDVLADYFLEHVRVDIQTGEDATIDLIQAEFKEYVLPAKIVAQRFDQIDSLLEEMNRYCHSLDPQYDPAQAEKVLMYAFEAALMAEVQVEPVVNALRTMEFTSLTPQDRAVLLDRVEERLASLRYEKAKNQEIAMEKALHMIEERHV